MKRKNVRITLLLGLLVCLFYACEHAEFLIPTNEQITAPEDPEITEARAWYELNKFKVLEVRGASHPLFGAMEPNWIESYTGEDDRFKTVETALATLQRKRTVLPECRQKYEETGDRRYLQSMIRLVIRTDMDGLKVEGFFMTIMPTVKYLEKTDFEPFHNTYMNRDDHFDGNILYHELDGSFTLGWKYADGTITDSIKPVAEPLTRGYITVCYDVFEETCTDYSYATEFSDPVHSGRNCTYRYAGERCSQQYVSSGGSGGSSGGGGNSGGGYPSGGSTPPPPPLPLIDRSDLTRDEYLDCAYASLQNNSPTFNNYQKTFIAENSIVHLKWQINDNLRETTYGQVVQEMDKYWMTIQLNSVQLMNRPVLCVAKTMIHELIHADMMAKLISLRPQSEGGNLNRKEFAQLSQYLTEKDYPGLYYFYEKYKYHGTAQHQLMAEYYVGIIAKTLHEVNSYVPMDVCTAIAWSGLEMTKTEINGGVVTVETEAWKKLSDKEKSEIIAKRNNYINNTRIECQSTY